MTSVLLTNYILISSVSLKANVFTNIGTGGKPINFATTDKHMSILKMYHGSNYYKYLVKCSSGTMWYFLVYGEDDETLIHAENWLDLKSANYAYNHFNMEEVEI